MKFTTVFALLALLSVAAGISGSLEENTVQHQVVKPLVCPCKCFVFGKRFFRKRQAKKQCLRNKFKGCIVDKCKKKFRKGFYCCNPLVSPTPAFTVSPRPSTTSTASATPSVSVTTSTSVKPSVIPSTPAVPSVSASPSPICPCKCRKGFFGRKKARKECRKLKPYCQVKRCGFRKFYCCFP